MRSRGRPRATPLSTRFLIYYAVAYLVLIGALGWFADREVRSALVEDLVASLEIDARVAQTSMPAEEAGLDDWAHLVFEAGGFRVTVIATDGVVLADSHTDPAVMGNHARRPEVIAALNGVVGRDSRRSISTGFSQHYLALPPVDGLILRVSLSEVAVADRLAPIRSRIVIASMLLGLIGVVTVAVLARRMARPIERLTDATLSIASGYLEMKPSRSSIREIDQLGQAIANLAEDLGDRLSQTETANETLEVVLGALPEGTILVGPEEGIMYANPTAYALLGSVPNELSGLDPHTFQTTVREARDTRQPVDLVVDHGSPARRLHAVAIPFAGDRRILLIVVDVSERERSASIRRDFVANASHELKTPVSSIISSSEALRTALERDPSAANKFAGHIEAAAHQLDRLVSDLLDLSRLERETPGTDPVRIDLVLNEEANHVREEADLGGVAVEVETVAATVAGSRRDLAIAFRNLLENAIRYTAAGGSVRATGRISEKDVVIQVVDTGAGIPSRDLTRVFERFYRVDNARSRSTGGTGLGLAIVKHAVESHGGTVEAQSELGQGSTFTVRLPLIGNGDSGTTPLA